ncbi:hypothetical protein FACS189449_08560 [Alphaproteobacteria bacterium]|nr:hypothetical protein FACS189449_08560 [Alphaproteobacteria bacterium]
MSVTEETLNAIHSRLQSLSQEATPEQVAYLAKAFEAVASNGKMIDIVNLTDQKLGEMLAKTNEHLTALSIHNETFIADLGDLKDEACEAIATVTDENLMSIINLVEARKPELAVLTEQFATVNDVPAGSSILKEITKEGNRIKFVQDGALPFVFGILSRYNDANWGVGSFTTELGTLGTASAADEMLKLLAGTHEYTTEYAGFYKEPSLCFLQGSKGNFIQKEMYLKYYASSSMYEYPYSALGVFFVKNTTNLAIATTINIGGSSYGAGGAVLVGTPNAENEEIAWQNIYVTSATSSGFSGTASFNVPANTTVAIILYTSSYYYTNTYSYYVQFLHWYVHSFRAETLVDGLEIDVEKTLKAWQCKGLSSTYDLWR